MGEGGGGDFDFVSNWLRKKHIILPVTSGRVSGVYGVWKRNQPYFIARQNKRNNLVSTLARQPGNVVDNDIISVSRIIPG